TGHAAERGDGGRGANLAVPEDTDAFEAKLIVRWQDEEQHIEISGLVSTDSSRRGLSQIDRAAFADHCVRKSGHAIGGKSSERNERGVWRPGHVVEKFPELDDQVVLVAAVVVEDAPEVDVGSLRERYVCPKQSPVAGPVEIARRSIGRGTTPLAVLSHELRRRDPKIDSVLSSEIVDVRCGGLSDGSGGEGRENHEWGY